MRRLALLLAGLALVPLVSCGDDGGPSADDGDPGDEVQTTPVTFGAGDEVWLRVATGGGFVPMIFIQREVPSVLLFDDGRLVRNVVAEDGSTGIVPRFEEVQLDETATADVLTEVAAVVDGPALGNPPVTDLATTTIEVTIDGETRTLDVYALGFDDGLSPDEASARRAAQDTVAGIQELGPAEPFVPDEWFVLTTALEGVQPGVASTPFPLDAERAASPQTPRVCTRITGDEVGLVLDALSGVDGTSPVETGTTLAEVALRPVLTGEETCNLGEFDDFVER